MTILAIETSCDETAVALVRSAASNSDRPLILAERIASQIALHAEYGGVVPELAAREHLRALPLLVEQILEEQSSVLVDAPLTRIAVTTGPGLKGSLLMGVNFAKGYGLANGIPVEGVNHIEGHLLSPLINNPSLTFPYLAVIVSGGHTEIHEVRGVGSYQVIERTLDDAAGEAFDKCAAVLGIPYPGGAELSKKAREATAHTAKEDSELYRVSASKTALSYSGLKTSFRLLVERVRNSGKALAVADACKAVECAIIETLVARVSAAIASTGVDRIAISGGVAANMPLRNALARLGPVFGAELRWCGDNAAMIGFAAALRLAAGIPSNDLEIRARWPVEEMSVHAR